MGRLACCGLLVLHVGASFGDLAALDGGGARVLAFPLNSEVETAWRPPCPHWSGQLQAIGRRQRRHLTRCLNRAWSQKQGPSLRLQGGRHWSGWPLRVQRVGEAQHPGTQAMLVDAGAMERVRSPPRRGEQTSTSLLPCGWMPSCQPPHRSWMGVPCSHAVPLGRPCRLNLAGGDPRGLLCRPQLGRLSGMWPSGCRSI